MARDAVFAWTDGSGADRKGDPLDLLRRLNCGSPAGDVNNLLDAADAADEGTAVPGAKALAALVCRVFALGEPWDESKGAGVLEGRWRAVLGDFLRHVAKNDGPAGTTPTCAPSSAPPPSDCPPPAGSGSDSTSAAA